MALVTGASGAIGSATVRALELEGYVVVGFDRIAATGAPHHHVIELSDAAALDAVVARVRALGPLAHVISIAGGAVPGEPATRDDPTKVSPELFRLSIDQNLTTQFLLLRAVLPWLRETVGRDRSVTFTSSFNALSAQGMAAYSAAKAGLIGMMYALVDPLGAEGIRINVLAPGTIRTPRTERLYADTPGHFERLARTTALGRVGTPDDMAEGYVALTRMRHTTGHVLVLDGGQVAIRR